MDEEVTRSMSHRELGVEEGDVVEAIRYRLPGSKTAGLAASDQCLLERGGLRFTAGQAHAEVGAIQVVDDQVALLSGSITPRTLALRLRLSESRIRHRIADRDIYAIRAGGRLLLPAWQFGADGSPLPGLRILLQAMGEDEHPLGVQSFMTTPQLDLESATGEPMSPRSWLASGGSPLAVAEILLRECW
jgi:hypothetical protein